MIFPPRLRPGDTVALVAPSSPLPPQQLKRAVREVEALGYRVRLGASLGETMPGGYAAGAPARRAADLHAAFCDAAVRGVWCLRGGSASAQVLPLLDYGLIARSPKVFIGFSDITNLHMVFQRRCGFVTYHGPMAGALGDPARFDETTLRGLLAALEMEDHLAVGAPGGLRVLRPGRAAGRLTGGNLSLLVSMLGTPYALEAQGCILFLEDVEEQVYAIDRMLHQLRYAGVFDAAAGVVLGDFSRCENQYSQEYGVCELFRDFFRGYPKPVVGGLPAGHCTPNLTLPMGAWCVLEHGEVWFERRPCGAAPAL